MPSSFVCLFFESLSSGSFSVALRAAQGFHHLIAVIKQVQSAKDNE